MQVIDPRFQTHTVDNQVPALDDFDAWAIDQPLRDAVARHGGDDPELLARYGRWVGGELNALGIEANRFRPQLRSFDRLGHRVDEVEFHPAYHRIMLEAMRHGVHAHAWRTATPGAHVTRAALSYLHHQSEAGTSCPLTMTFAAMPVLRQGGAALRAWAEGAAALDYDAAGLPVGRKRSLTLGMGMTEKQGGSDVRANTTSAQPIGDGAYRLIGHKWFFSAPMSDGFLVLAQAPAGLTCFLLPRWCPDGARNAICIMRLKEKLGNWANASSEVEFQGALAWRVGEEGRGVATILEMVALTRLDCALGSAAEMRRALIEAVHHAAHRRAFGKRLIEQPLMREVLADLALESEAATAFAVRIAAAVDAAPRDPREAAFARVATAIGKFWICKRAPGFVNEAQECLGGAGYVEEHILPRLYREAPLNAIWEGSGNIQCLDVLRALGKDPAVSAALLVELQAAIGLHAAYDDALAGVIDQLRGQPDTLECAARGLVSTLALLLQASLLLRHAEPAIAATFCTARLGGFAAMYGSALPADAPIALLLQRVGVLD